MLAALIVALCVQAPPKASALGKEKPWWEKLRVGYLVRIDAIPGTAIPMAPLNHRSGLQGRVRTDVYAAMFAQAVAGNRWADIHRMVDRGQLVHPYSGTWVQIVVVREDPMWQGPVAEVVVLGPAVASGNSPAPIRDGPPPTIRVPEPCLFANALPVAYLGAPDQARHPMLDRLPVLVRRSKDLATVACDEPDCSHMEAVSYADAERAWKDRQKQSEEAKRRGAVEAKRRVSERRNSSASPSQEHHSLFWRTLATTSRAARTTTASTSSASGVGQVLP